MSEPTAPQSRLSQLLGSLQDINNAIAQTDQQLSDASGNFDDLAQAIADLGAGNE